MLITVSSKVMYNIIAFISLSLSLSLSLSPNICQYPPLLQDLPPLKEEGQERREVVLPHFNHQGHYHHSNLRSQMCDSAHNLDNNDIHELTVMIFMN